MMLTPITASFGVLFEAALKDLKPIAGTFGVKPDEYGESEGFHLVDDSGDFTGTSGYHDDGTDNSQGSVKMLKPRSGAGTWYYESDGIRWLSVKRQILAS